MIPLALIGCGAGRAQTPTPTAVPLPTATPTTAPPTPSPPPVPAPTATHTPTATPASTATPTSVPSPSPTATAEPRLFTLRVGEPPDTPPYDRDQWQHWIDQDGDCQDTRQEVLISESLVAVTLVTTGCRVDAGQWLSLYTGTTVTDPGALDIDHMVPLANAHRSGGWAWDAEMKKAYANDLVEPGHLIAVTAGSNRSKGDQGPEDWRPPDESYWCPYAMDWIQIKVKWDLSATDAEVFALRSMLDTCGTPVGIATVVEAGASRTPTATPSPIPAPVSLPFDPFGPDRDCSDFTSWEVASAFFTAAGGPVADPHRLDPDRDGDPCESLR